MALFPKFPYVNDHQLNLDWIVRLFRSLHGGLSGQVLTKRSNKDYDWEWQAAGGGGGTDDYNDLTNKPSINGVTLSGNKTTTQLGITNEIFWAVYNSTTSAQVESAYQDGLLVCCSYNNRVYVLTNRASSTSHRFTAVVQNINYSLFLNNNTWSTTSSTFALSSAVHSIPSGGTAGQVLAKVDAADYNVEWVNSGGGGGTAELYWAEYGVTTSAEIETAYQAGLLVCCDYDGRVYVLGDRTSATRHYLFGGTTTRLWYLDVNANTWSRGSRLIPSGSSNLPQSLGTAAVGTGTNFARDDHVHAMPSASDVGAIGAPASPTIGDFLVYTSGGWDAVTMAEWQGGNY